ncbi:MAG: hypothetical protein JXB39_05145 [Deltaproteobacteria bacterium]|nr:hypothetical protein [Deltaproteobacteria bacterium]
MRLPPLALLLVLLALPSPSRAQGRVMKLEGITVIGKVQKPEVMMVITRQNLHADYTLELRESFLPKIVRSIDDDLFQ